MAHGPEQKQDHGSLLTAHRGWRRQCARSRGGFWTRAYLEHGEAFGGVDAEHAAQEVDELRGGADARELREEVVHVRLLGGVHHDRFVVVLPPLLEGPQAGGEGVQQDAGAPHVRLAAVVALAAVPARNGCSRETCTLQLGTPAGLGTSLYADSIRRDCAENMRCCLEKARPRGLCCGMSAHPHARRI